MNNLNRTILKIKKKFGQQAIGRVKDLKRVDVERISTGSPYLDWATQGGFPRGRTVEIYGPYSSGKTLCVLRTIVSAQKQGLSCVFIDSERAFDPKFAEKLGVDLDKLVLVRETEGEKVFDIIGLLLQGDVGIITVDSVASLVPQFEEENPIQQQTMALQARLMSKALRKLTGAIGKSNTLVIFINQIREKLSSYGNPEITSGGRALGFYSSLRIEVRRGDWILKNKKKIGQMIKFRVTKSKVCPAWKEGAFKYFYKGTFDEIYEIVTLLLLNGKIIRTGGWYKVLGQRFQGRAELEKKIKTDNKFKEQLLKL